MLVMIIPLVAWLYCLTNSAQSVYSAIYVSIKIKTGIYLHITVVKAWNFVNTFSVFSNKP